VVEIAVTLATAVRRAAAQLAARGCSLRGVLVVEGESDQRVLETIASRLGRDLAGEGVAIVPIGGATNLGHLLREVAAADAAITVSGLCDADQEQAFRWHLRVAGLGAPRDRAELAALGFHVCDRDLEDELLRAAGTDAALAVVEAQDEARAFATFRRQPAQRDRPVDEQLRRFIGTRSGRKARYGQALAEALDLTALPTPLRLVLGAP
jgi:hypothetical protein